MLPETKRAKFKLIPYQPRPPVDILSRSQVKIEENFASLSCQPASEFLNHTVKSSEFFIACKR
jgi:hypothetical protein